MPGATSSHSGSAHRCGAGNTGSSPVSAAIRCARRSQSDVGGRSTSVGQETKESMTGRSVSSSCRHSAHAEMWLPRRALRSKGGPAGRTGTPFQVVPIVVADAELIGPSCFGQRLSELCQSGAHACLDGSERLIQLRRHFAIRQLGEERGLDRLALVRREDLQGLSQEAALLPDVEGLLGIMRSRRRKRTVGIDRRRASSAVRTAAGRSLWSAPGS